jgi:hypothetical protein
MCIKKTVARAMIRFALHDIFESLIRTDEDWEVDLTMRYLHISGTCITDLNAMTVNAGIKPLPCLVSKEKVDTISFGLPVSSLSGIERDLTQAEANAEELVDGHTVCILTLKRPKIPPVRLYFVNVFGSESIDSKWFCVFSSSHGF